MTNPAASVAQALVIVPAVALTAAVGPAANYVRDDLLFPSRENSSTIRNRGWDDIKLNNFFLGFRRIFRGNAELITKKIDQCSTKRNIGR